MEVPTNIEGVLGFLVFDGTEKLYAVDGQHRIVGIREAVKENSGLQYEEVATIFVAHGDPE